MIFYGYTHPRAKKTPDLYFLSICLQTGAKFAHTCISVHWSTALEYNGQITYERLVVLCQRLVCISYIVYMLYTS